MVYWHIAIVVVVVVAVVVIVVVVVVVEVVLVAVGAVGAGGLPIQEDFDIFITVWSCGFPVIFYEVNSVPNNCNYTVRHRNLDSLSMQRIEISKDLFLYTG